MAAGAPGYLPRTADTELAELLTAVGTVVIEGARACGKTETARRAARSEVLFDVDRQAREAAALDPNLILRGPAPRLLDEWQLAPGIWNAVRREADERAKASHAGQFILTGSATPADDITRHSGAGRIARLRMRPMSLFESGHSSADISLAALLSGHRQPSPDTALSVSTIADRITVGGWPALQRSDVQEAMRVVRAYVDETCRVDVARVAGSRRDPARIRRLLRSLARNVTTYAKATTIRADTAAGGAPLDEETVAEYLSALERIFIVENQPAWAPSLRSRAIVRRGDKRLFVDPSIAVGALGVGPERLLKDLNLLGFLFENLVIRDLRIYAQAMDAEVLQYRDNHLEVDAIVEARSGVWGAFEVKLGFGEVDTGAASLLRFADRINTAQTGKPAVLGVITGTGYGYTRADGVAVIPIGALGP